MSSPNEDLISALRKLGFSTNHPRFQSLPARDSDPLWEKLAEKYQFNEFELGALKNARVDLGQSNYQGIYRSKIINGRSQKQVSFKSLEDLDNAIEREWPLLRYCNYSLCLKKNSLIHRIDLAMLQPYPEENCILVKKDLTGFSKVSKERATGELGVVLDDFD
eukprot:gene7283-7858_t